MSRGRNYFYSYFIDVETETLMHHGCCPVSHSKVAAEPGVKSWSSNDKVGSLSNSLTWPPFFSFVFLAFMWSMDLDFGMEMAFGN